MPGVRRDLVVRLDVLPRPGGARLLGLQAQRADRRVSAPEESPISPIPGVGLAVIRGDKLPTVEELECVRTHYYSAEDKHRIDPYRPVPDELRRPLTPAEQVAVELWRISGRGFSRYYRLYRSGVPWRLWGAHFASAERTAMVERGQQYANEQYDQGRAIVFLSSTGRGKTFTGVCVMASVGEGRFVHAGELARKLQNFDTQEAMFERATTEPFLVIDDLGAEYVREGGMVESLLSEIIWHRESACLPLLITTNLTPDAFKARIGDRAFDRLTGDEWGALFVDKGPSRRQVKPVKKAVA